MDVETVFPGMARPFNLRDIFLRLPEQALGLIDLYQTLMRGPSQLTAGERELIYAYGSLAAGCHFCYASHSRCAVKLGIAQEVFQKAPAQLDGAPLRPGVASLLRYTTALIVDGPACRGPREECVALTGMDSGMLLDAVLVAGLTAYVNRLINGVGAYLPDELHARNGELLARFGYVQVREEVLRSLREAGVLRGSRWPAAVQRLPESLRARSEPLAMLHSYAQLVFEGPSRVPAALRRDIRDEMLRTDSRAGEAHRADGELSATARRRAMGFARRLATAPVQSTSEDIAGLFALGWAERDVIDLVVTVATAAFLSRVSSGLEECGLACADHQPACERAPVQQHGGMDE